MGWVTDRHRCTLDLAFADLKDAIRTDVDEANKLLPESRREADPFLFDDKSHMGARFVVQGHPIRDHDRFSRYTFVFEKQENQLCIVRNRPDRLPKLGPLVVSQKWVVATASCALFMGDQQVSIAEISQRALESMFFGV